MGGIFWGLGRDVAIGRAKFFFFFFSHRPLMFLCTYVVRCDFYDAVQRCITKVLYIRREAGNMID